MSRVRKKFPRPVGFYLTPFLTYGYSIARLNKEVKIMTFRNGQQAFDEAIQQGRLSVDPNGPSFAGNYMYMGTEDSGRDLFKNINTRRYDV